MNGSTAQLQIRAIVTAYIRALEVHCSKLTTIQGKYIAFPGTYYAANEKDNVDFSRKLRVIRSEEKQTDVNIALHMITDAADGPLRSTSAGK